ncbi:MAG TPA: hypothetical protein VFX02_02765 [Gammaproteobacteria bacterium]|nr:hypothetical protein [Gammaproteobacteria bacterium]
MNKTPMNNDDWLDKILSGDDDYIHDDGFTEAVLRRLPARQRPVPHGLILGCAALLAVAVLLLSAPSPASWYDQFIAFLYTQPLPRLFAMALAVCSAISAITWWVIEPDS